MSEPRAKRLSVLQRGCFAALMACGLILADDAATAGDAPIAVGEVSAPPSSSGIDAAGVRDTAEIEIRQIDASRIPARGRYVVSFALSHPAANDVVECNVSAMVRDARTGNMIAIIETASHADGPSSAELRKQVAFAAVRSAVRRIPRALGAK